MRTAGLAADLIATRPKTRDLRHFLAHQRLLPVGLGLPDSNVRAAGRADNQLSSRPLHLPRLIHRTGMHGQNR